ncbi:WD40 repeat-like protein [Tricholoma matsutake]|nr:WD40 repeat-like protein [Tricholoma matsutake 945]
MGKDGKNKLAEPPTKKPRVEKSATKTVVPNVKGLRTSSYKPKSIVSKEPITAGGKGKKREKEKDVGTRPSTPPPKKSQAKSRLKPKQDTPRSLPSTFKVIAGSYEKLLYGLEGTVTLNEASTPQFHLKAVFIFPAHVSCIKSVAASPGGGKWLATGSADEIIKVWDLRRKKEVGGLMHHQGSITHLSFPSRSHLLSASEDGSLCLFRARDWSVLRALKGHKARVNSVAVHPSGKVALSVGKDNMLRMWDLMRGRGCASTKLGKEGEVVRWSIDGSLFIVLAGSAIDVYSTNMDHLHTINHPSRLHDARFCKRVVGAGEVLLVAAEDKKLSIYDISNEPEKIPSVIALMTGHSNRVKAVQTLDIALPSSPAGLASTTIVCTVSSDGKIHLYDMATVPEHTGTTKIVELNPIAEYDSKGTRLTCVALADGEAVEPPVNGKRKRGEEDASASEDEDEDGVLEDDDNTEDASEDESREDEAGEEARTQEDDSEEDIE